MTTEQDLRRDEARMNAWRAQRAETLIHTYASEHGLEDEPFRDVAVDIIADVLHAIARHQSEPEDAHAIAWRHFISERAAAGES